MENAVLAALRSIFRQKLKNSVSPLLQWGLLMTCTNRLLNATHSHTSPKWYVSRVTDDFDMHIDHVVGKPLRRQYDLKRRILGIIGIDRRRSVD